MGIIRSSARTITKFFPGALKARGFSIGSITGLSVASRSDLLREYNGIVYNCISKRAKSFARYEPIIYASDPSQGEVEPIDHDFKKILSNPNPHTTKYKLLVSHKSYKLICGDAWLFVAYNEAGTVPLEFWNVRPDLLDVVIGSDGLVRGYVLHGAMGQVIPLEPNEIIPDAEWNPNDPYRGKGKVEANLLAIETDQNTALFQRNFIKNNAAPAGVITLNGEIEDEVFDEFKKNWNSKYSGARNAGKTVILAEAQAEFTKIGLSLGDLDMTALRKISQQEIYNAFEVPKSLFGETDSAGLGRDAVDSVLYGYEALTIDPDWDEFDDVIKLAIKTIYGEEVWVEHKSYIPEDKAAKLQEQLAKVNTVWTVNQVLAQDGLDGIGAAGDNLFVPFNVTPINEVGNTEIAPAQKALTGNTVRIVKKKVLVTKKKPTESQYFKAIRRIKDKTAKAIDAKLTPLLNKQRDKLIAAMLRQLNKTTADVEDFIGSAMLELINSDAEIDVFSKAIFEQVMLGYDNGGQTATVYLGAPSEDFVISQATRNAVFAEEEKLVKQFGQQTGLRIEKATARTLQEATDKGLSKAETQKLLKGRIEEVYAEAKGYRAERIARTEAHRAINAAQADAYSQQGVVKIRWKANDSACPECAAMDGKIVDIGEPFLLEGDTISGSDETSITANYGDVKHADLHPNCNCQLEPVLEKL